MIGTNLLSDTHRFSHAEAKSLSATQIN